MVCLVEFAPDAAGERMEERRRDFFGLADWNGFCVHTAAAPKTADPLSSRSLAAVSSIRADSSSHFVVALEQAPGASLGHAEHLPGSLVRVALLSASSSAQSRSPTVPLETAGTYLAPV